MRFVLLALAIAFVALMVTVGVTAYVVLPFSRSEEPDTITVIVEPGQTLWSVARRLEDAGVVRSARALVLAMRVLGREKGIHTGEYTFSAGAGVFGSIERFEHPRPLENLVTFPEGLTIWQTAHRAHVALGSDSARFVALCEDSVFSAGLGLDVPTLEGYLYPDTYRFPPGVGEEEVIRTMVRRFEEVWQTLTPDFSVGVELNRKQAVILASIIEKEATVAHERTRISGVFHNRLRIGYSLGADPTVRYALRKFSGPLRVSELRNPHPYNTRVHRGLPPGPICSVGRGSLQAAVAPLKTRDLYFVAKWDGSGEHDFSETMREHDRKKLEIRQANQERLRATAGDS